MNVFPDKFGSFEESVTEKKSIKMAGKGTTQFMNEKLAEETPMFSKVNNYKDAFHNTWHVGQNSAEDTRYGIGFVLIQPKLTATFKINCVRCEFWIVGRPFSSLCL